MRQQHTSGSSTLPVRRDHGDVLHDFHGQVEHLQSTQAYTQLRTQLHAVWTATAVSKRSQCAVSPCRNTSCSPARAQNFARTAAECRAIAAEPARLPPPPSLPRHPHASSPPSPSAPPRRLRRRVATVAADALRAPSLRPQLLPSAQLLLPLPQPQLRLPLWRQRQPAGHQQRGMTQRPPRGPTPLRAQQTVVRGEACAPPRPHARGRTTGAAR